MFDINVRILELLSKNSNLTQREIAQELDVSVGRVNSRIKKLQLSGSLKIKATSAKNKEYLVTEIGNKLLVKNMETLKDIRLNIHKEDSKKIKLAVILGAGEVKTSDRPAGFIKYNSKLVIERMLDVLYENGIEQVITVSGYKNEYYKELTRVDKRVKNIVNNDYKTTGSMISLKMCKELIDNDFILIENDLIFESRAISELIKEKNKDCVLISNFSDKERKIMAEIRNNKLFKLSKDMRDFNRIDGEIVGITKISKKFYNLMLDEMKHNENKLVNYEHILMDVSRKYTVGVRKIEDLWWKEII